MPHSMTMFLKITGVDKMLLNKLHELLNGNSFMSKTRLSDGGGLRSKTIPMNRVILKNSKLDLGTYTITLEIDVVTRNRKMSTQGNRKMSTQEGYFFTSRRIIDQIFQALEIMPEDETFVEIPDIR